jgi:hypothetical protein
LEIPACPLEEICAIWATSQPTEPGWDVEADPAGVGRASAWLVDLVADGSVAGSDDPD